MITVMVFDGKNYDLWERVARLALKAKNKLVFMDGTLKRPKDNDEAELLQCRAWHMASSMLCSWLPSIIDQKLKIILAYSDTAKGMWDDVWKQCAMANTPKIH